MNHAAPRLVALLAVLFGALSVHAQGTLTVLQTGGGQPLVSDQVVLQTDGVPGSVIHFDFGFVTDQTPGPGIFLDSFTASLQDDSSDVAVVATLDASGATWAPSSPGAVPLTSDDIQFQAITPPSQSPILEQGIAYGVFVTVPSSFTGSSVTVDFDLFDNQDPTTSATGWFDNVEVAAVPEPPAEVLAALGIALLAFKRKMSR